ncbi:NAD-dependent histone deacetylase sirtuin-1 [Agrilus planipennis]|uniref:protein acetyllysine N-acetyltransferase n=1 Tax=Agrilus planipennis TaxID=224129 RepID=A0A1W4WL89_AGRPL|nr:NAD-dependent histone deacetylase sirtuin-1 [Agrilus planipennis]
MDSSQDHEESEFHCKRIKLDVTQPNLSVLCQEEFNSATTVPCDRAIENSEGILADCDSGYEASTLESLPTPTHQVSPLSHSEIPDALSGFASESDNLNLSSCNPSQEDDDNASTISHFSDLSGLSDVSLHDWKFTSGSMVWVHKQMQNGVDPRMLLVELGANVDQIPPYLDDVTLWKLLINMVAEPPQRNKLRHVNTLEDVVRLLKGAKKVIVLTGAGVSVSCGIPDFRSKDGIYSRLAKDFPDLVDPQSMFDINYFNQDPRPFFKFAKDIYPGIFEPSPCHKFIRLLEKQGKLLRNYTQNIDTLEKIANIDRVIECHGSFATASCTNCGQKASADEIRDTVLSQKIPLCTRCHPAGPHFVDPNDEIYRCDPRALRRLVESGIMKPDIVFFGEGLPDAFHEAMAGDKNECDLLLVIGSSLKVRPVALIPNSLPAHVPQILINREPLPHCHFDVELLGDCDGIVNHLCQLLGSAWEEGVYDETALEETLQLLPLNEKKCKDTNESDVSSSPDAVVKDDSSSTTVRGLEMSSEEVTCECRSVTVRERNCSCKFTLTTKQSSWFKQEVNEFNELDTTSSKEKLLLLEREIVEAKQFKQRHISVDSAQDSGIGENSNFTDSEGFKYDTSDETNDSTRMDIPAATPSDVGSHHWDLINDERTSSSKSCSEDPPPPPPPPTNPADLRDYWQPKVKHSLVDRLPEGTYYMIPPCRYIFPGAEVYYDPDEKYDYFDDSSSSESSDSEETDEN